MALTNSDTLALLIYLTRMDVFTADTETLHCAMAEAQVSCPVLSCFLFGRPRPYPYSNDLEAAFSRLSLGKVLTLERDMECYGVRGRGRAYIEEHIVPQATPEEIEELSQAAELVRTRCAVPALT